MVRRWAVALFLMLASFGYLIAGLGVVFGIIAAWMIYAIIAACFVAFYYTMSAAVGVLDERAPDGP